MRLVLMALIMIVSLGYFVCDGKKTRLRGVQWWALAKMGQASNDVLRPTEPVFVNPSLQQLTRRQRRLVTKNPGTVLAVAKGAKMAIEECQYQFHDRKWNCPTSDNTHGGSIFGKILQKGCRETAFIYAITSAAVAHSVARGCAEGSILTCACGVTSKQPSGRDWEWGGCSDNAKFGNKFARKFVDVVEKGRDFRYMMNLHNNEAGRMHVRANMAQDCKCHGMSGSCTIKTCWMRLPTFRKIGTYLKDRFDGASRVIPGNEGSNRTPNQKRFKFIPVNPLHKPPTRKDLVYFENSPDFCVEDNTIGFKGTKGRECNATSIGVDGCDLMCCGRGYKTETYIHKERCSCTFHWCCHVKCDTCTRTRMRHTCL
ncbi:protein Wnt-1-like isoform X2 [Liolophura sinensis]|uniref:protein Wnt-1-like isoform X2 n=1 Tax=Liolophura sinensis TaxID=3198878 RepID=UPI0031591453